MFVLCWTYVGVCFIHKLYLTAPCVILMFYQSVLYVVVEASSCFSYFSLIFSLRMLNLFFIVFRYI